MTSFGTARADAGRDDYGEILVQALWPAVSPVDARPTDLMNPMNKLVTCFLRERLMRAPASWTMMIS